MFVKNVTLWLRKQRLKVNDKILFTNSADVACVKRGL